MRVLILASSSQKAQVADKLLNSGDLSKVLVSRGSNKLVAKAQALVVYFESKEDLKKLRKLRQIYLGVPLKFYFGNKNYSIKKDGPNKWADQFFNFDKGDELAKAIPEQYKKVQFASEIIYEHIIKPIPNQPELPTVQHLLRSLEENERDVIEEKCIEFFGKSSQVGDASSLSADKTIVPKERFVYWWSQGKLDGFEIIKYYLIPWIMAEINKRDTGFIIDNGDGLSGKAFKEDISKYFEDYNVKNQSKIQRKLQQSQDSTDSKAQVNILNTKQFQVSQNYECNFRLQIPLYEEKKKAVEGANTADKPAGADTQAAAQTQQAPATDAAKNDSLIGPTGELHIADDPKTQEEEKKSSEPVLNKDTGFEQIDTTTKQEGQVEGPQLGATVKLPPQVPVKEVQAAVPKGTVLEVKIQLYPHSGDDSIVYYKNLHMFKSTSWLSIGLKPKAKDLKTVIDDLKQMEYLQTIMNVESLTNTIALDGRKVRLGFEGGSLDVLVRKHEEKAKLIKSMCTHLSGADYKTEKVLQPEFEFKFIIGQKLDQMLYSDDPIVVSLFKGMTLDVSLQLHKKQFEPILWTTSQKRVENKIEEFKKNLEEKLKQQSLKLQEQEDKKAQQQQQEATGPNINSEQVAQHGAESDDEVEMKSDEEDDEGDETKEKNKAKVEEEKEEKFDLATVFKYLLPTFLFRWNGNVTISPDLAEIKRYCTEHESESSILKNFKALAKAQGVEDLNLKKGQVVGKGSRKQLYNYIQTEVGREIEFAWMTEHFYLSGQIKSDDLGKAVKYLSNGKFLP